MPDNPLYEQPEALVRAHAPTRYGAARYGPPRYGALGADRYAERAGTKRK
jgi:hypothetical protein